MFNLVIDSKLRGCDLVNVKICVKIYDLVSGSKVRSCAIVIQQKTGTPVQFELLEPAQGSILARLERRAGALDGFAFPSRIDHADHVSTLPSLRRTKTSLIYEQTENLRAIEILLGHTRSAIRGGIQDTLTLAEGAEM